MQRSVVASAPETAILRSGHAEDLQAVDSRMLEDRHVLSQVIAKVDAAPAQRVTDFLARRASVDLPRTSFPMGTYASDLWTLLPSEICEGMEAAILAFDKDLPGFAGSEAVLIAPETRTTSPVSFERTDDGESSIPGLYLVGEGAGYAGGIVSSALDGLRAARQVSLLCGRA